MAKVFLWGMMGSGKSTVAKKLANRVGYSVLDTDHLVELNAGMSISEIFEKKGENQFRLMESAVLDEVLSSDENAIVATGGGLPCFKNNASKMLDGGLCIYLEASVDQLASRLMQSGDNRPLIKQSTGREELIQKLETLLTARLACYEKATLKVSAMNVDLVSLTEQVRSFQDDLGL